MGRKKCGGVVRLAARRARDKPTDPERKLSEIIKEMGLRLFTSSSSTPSPGPMR